MVYDVSNSIAINEPTYAVIGGGIAGSTAAVHLAELGANVHLVEKGPSLVNGPPICHLHAGGNLYREISESQCLELLRQSIETVRFFPHTLNVRPTILAIPLEDSGATDVLVERLKVIANAYHQLVQQDPKNKVLGEPEAYYQLYTKEDLIRIAQMQQPSKLNNTDDWVIPFAQHADLEKLKYPVIAVQEYGWSVFRVAASVSLTLESHSNCQLHLNTQLVNVVEFDNGWKLECKNQSGQTETLYADYLINSCGYETGVIDDLVEHPNKRLVEFKAAYVTKWESCHQKWPEVIFYGVRGTKNGMAQLTPYPNGVFQIHGMTENITLFSDGLVASENGSSQPLLPMRLQDKLQNGWCEQVVADRTTNAIHHLSQFIPSFETARPLGKPLYGAQQIPGDNVTLRAADVSFASHNYARIEVVKGSSSVEAARKIIAQWNIDAINKIRPSSTPHLPANAQNEELIEKLAIELARQRDYPQELAEAIN